MSSKDRFEKTFSRKNTMKTTNENNNKTSKLNSKPKQQSSEPPSPKPQIKITPPKPTKITIKLKQPTKNKEDEPAGSVKPKQEKGNLEKDDILIKELKRKPEIGNGNVGQEKDKVKKMKTTSSKAGKTGKKEKKKKKKKKKKRDDDDEEGLECAFPTARITRIVKSQGSDCKITAEAVFLINKATQQQQHYPNAFKAPGGKGADEKFIELFAEDAYGCAVEDHKNFVGYKHLSSAVSKGKVFEFLSDFVPEKVEAEKALAERNPPTTLPA